MRLNHWRMKQDVTRKKNETRRAKWCVQSENNKRNKTKNVYIEELYRTTNFLAHQFMWHCTKMLGYMLKMPCELLTSTGTFCVCLSVYVQCIVISYKIEMRQKLVNINVKLQLFSIHVCTTVTHTM